MKNRFSRHFAKTQGRLYRRPSTADVSVSEKRESALAVKILSHFSETHPASSLFSHTFPDILQIGVLLFHPANQIADRSKCNTGKKFLHSGGVYNGILFNHVAKYFP